MNLTKVFAAGVIFVALFTMIGCNTMEGAGRDVESVGEGVQDIAR
jgi:predicted small secreted protein